PPPRPTLFPYTTLFRSHPEFRHSRKAADDSVGNSVREILDVGVSTHVYERQHSYGVNPPGPESAQEPLAPVARRERDQQQKQDEIGRASCREREEEWAD